MSNSKKSLLFYVIVILVVVLFFVCMKPILNLMRSKAAGPALSISPSSINANVGDNISASIMIDTTGNNVDGVDVYKLRFNPSILKVTDDDAVKSGVQISAGTLFPVTTVNSVDNSAGTIQFSQLATGGTTFNGSGTLATIHFQVLATGNSTIDFDFSRGSTTDTNIAGGGADQLVVVGNGGVIVSSLPTPTPDPTPTPTPTPVAKFTIGQQVQTTAKINVRKAAGGGTTGKQAAGATGVVSAGPSTVNGTNWWNINFTTGTDGWVSETYLK